MFSFAIVLFCWLLILLAVFLLVRRLIRAFRGKGDCADCGGCDCAFCAKAEKKDE